MATVTVKGALPGLADAIPVECGTGGSVVTNTGPNTVYYRDESPVSRSVNDGSIAAGVTVTLYETQWFVVDEGASASRSDSATLNVGPYTAGGASNANRYPRIATFGHSFVAGYQTTEGGDRWSSKLAAALHAEELTYGHTSAVLAVDDSSSWPGGYATVLNGLRPKTQSPATSADRTAAPYVALAPAVVFFYGVNDLAKLNANVTTNIAWFKMALRAITCLARCGGIFIDTHASVSFGSGWSGSQSLPKYGSPTSRSTTTVGSAVTITVPADFPGGEIDLFTRAFSGGGPKWSTTVDGGAAQVLDGTGVAYGANTSRSNVLVQRLTGLSAGAHTIVMTLAAIDASASGFFDSWAIVAPDVPTVVLCNQPSGSPIYPWATGGAHDPVTSSDVQSMNAAIAALATEFADGRVVVADVDAYFAASGGNVALGQPGSLYFSDGIHVKGRGHSLIAQCVADALDAAPAPARITRYGPSGSVMRPVRANGYSAAWAFGGDPALGANWAAYLTNTNTFGRDRAGNTILQLDLVRTGAPTLNETVFFLTPGYAPATDQLIPALSWNAAQTTATAGLLMAKANGNVVWIAGDPTTRLQASGVFPANGLPNN